MKRRCSIPTPLGQMIAIAENEALCELLFAGERTASPPADCVNTPEHPLFHELQNQLAAYFAGERISFTLPLAPQGTPFQKRVWDLLLAIPHGTTTTYGALARRVSEERGVEITAPQAIGGAVGRNPIAIIIPCHRVIGADGSLTGYAGGLDRKAALLALENGEQMPPKR